MANTWAFCQVVYSRLFLNSFYIKKDLLIIHRSNTNDGRIVKPIRYADCDWLMNYSQCFFSFSQDLFVISQILASMWIKKSRNSQYLKLNVIEVWSYLKLIVRAWCLINMKLCITSKLWDLSLLKRLFFSSKTLAAEFIYPVHVPIGFFNALVDKYQQHGDLVSSFIRTIWGLSCWSSDWKCV